MFLKRSWISVSIGFKAARLIYEVEGDTAGFLPARGLASITLQQIVDAVEGEVTVQLTNGLPSVERDRVLGDLRGIPAGSFGDGYGRVVVVRDV